MQTETVIADVPVRVAEISGEAGDVVVAHPWLLHCAPTPNCGDVPRLMRVQRIRTSLGLGPVDLADES